MLIQQISEHVEEQMRMTLTYSYGFENHSRVENARITEFWDLMQRQVTLLERKGDGEGRGGGGDGCGDGICLLVC